MSFRDTSKQTAKKKPRTNNAFAANARQQQTMIDDDLFNNNNNNSNRPSTTISNDTNDEKGSITLLADLVEKSVGQLQRDSKFLEESEKKLGTDKDTRQLRSDMYVLVCCCLMDSSY
jgi:hypothetical protein